MKRCILKSFLVFNLILLVFSGCSTNHFDATNIQDSVMNFLHSEQSLTSTAISSTTNASKKNAMLQYLNSIALTVTEGESGDGITYNCTLSFPSLQAIQDSLSNSDAFVSEFEITDDTDGCIYGYITNTLLSNSSILTEEDSFSVNGQNETNAISNLEMEADNRCQQLLSMFALKEFYNDGVKKEEGSFVNATNFDDFVVRIAKNKLLISNIKIYNSSRAIEELESLSPNNALINPGTQNPVYVIKYNVTNLSRKKVTVKNYFCLGDDTYHMYTNTGFHIEGLRSTATLSQGETSQMVAALVGDANSNLYYYDNSMIGAVHWDEIPVQK